MQITECHCNLSALTVALLFVGLGQEVEVQSIRHLKGAGLVRCTT
jgi:hypothetical protein